MLKDQMKKEDYTFMYKDGMFWFVVLFVLICFIAVATIELLVFFTLGFLLSVFILIGIAAYKMYKKNRYWDGT